MNWIDKISIRTSQCLAWLLLLCAFISASNAIIRKIFNESSNAWLELQWYLYASVFLLGAGYVLLQNEHVRIDIFYGKFSEKTKAKINALCYFTCILPLCLFIIYLGFGYFAKSVIGEQAFNNSNFFEATQLVFLSFFDSTHWEKSSNAGGLYTWFAKILIPAGFILLALQTVSEGVKYYAKLKHKG